MLRSSPDRAAEVDELLREPGVGFAPIARGRPAISYRTNQPASCVGVRHIGPFRASLRIMGRYVQFGRSKPIQIGCFRALMRRELCISGFSVHRCRKRVDMHRCDTARGALRHRHASYATIWTFSPAAISAPFRGKRRSSCQRIDSCYFFVFTALAFDQLE